MFAAIRRAVARAILAIYSFGIYVFGSIFQSPTPAEVPADSTPCTVPAGDLGLALRNVNGFARVVLSIGGVTFRVNGHVVDGAARRFVPSPWWAERGAVERLLDS
jgi:hypothetical protein